MLEGLREALGYVVELGNNAAKTEVVLPAAVVENWSAMTRLIMQSR